jgi:hypothetical protein
MNEMKIRATRKLLSNLPDNGVVTSSGNGRDRRWFIEYGDNQSISIVFDPPLPEDIERNMTRFLAEGKNLTEYFMEGYLNKESDNDSLTKSFYFVFAQLMGQVQELKEQVAELMAELAKDDEPDQETINQG